MGGRGAVGVALALWAGLLIGPGLMAPAIAAAVLLSSFLLAIAWRAPDRTGTVALLLAIACAGAARGAAHERRLERSASIPAEGCVSWLIGTVADHPWREAEEPAAIVRVERGAGVVARGARVRVRLPAGSELEWGDRLEMLARLDRPLDRRSPGGGSARDAARAQGLVAAGRARVAARTASKASWTRGSVTRWRRAIERAFARGLSAEAREVVTPIVVGDRSALRPELNARLQAAGLTHLIALSGLHVVWMAAVARGIAAVLGRGVRTRAVVGAGCAVFYVGIAGPLPSLARAASAEALGALAALRGRALDPLHALALGAAALLALAPGWARDLGFQLSCATTLGLVTLGPALAAALAGVPAVFRGIASALAPTTAAQIASLPLILARFHALPWSALGANLLAIPICELLLAAAWLGAALEIAAPGAGAWAFRACEVLVAALREVAARAATLPGSLVATGHAPGVIALATWGALRLVTAAVPRVPQSLGLRDDARRRWALVLAMTALALSIGMAVTTPALRPPPGRWWMVTLDVGQGDAIALGFDDGTWWLVDAGASTPRFDAGASIVAPFFRWAAVRRLETLAITHEHGDHAGGTRAVMASLAVGRVVVPDGGSRRAAALRVARGDTLRREPPVVVVRWPERGARPPDPNAGSLVLDVGAARDRAWLAADVDSLVERAVGDSLPASVLKVGHHGARSSSGASFLGRLRPRHAVVSCGRGNPFGHPHPSTLRRLRAAGARVSRTDLEGTVWLELGPEGARRLDWRRGELARDAAPATRARVPASLAGAPARW